MISIKDKDRKIPFVKELMVESLTSAGMKPWQAYSFTREIQDEIIAKGQEEIERDELYELVHTRLMTINEKTAHRFKAWRDIRRGDNDPIIILLGGGTGVGTTTVGTELAHRLGIKNIIATDSIREVMRKTVSDKLLPALHSSSYDTYKSMSVPLSNEKDKMMTGFKLQVAEVSVGVEAIIERALKEGTPTLIEGLHVIPGFISKELLDKYNVMVFTLHIKNEKTHKDHLYSRAFETKFKRSVEGYMDNFKNIRDIQKYIIKNSEDNKVPVIENLESEKTIVGIMDQVIGQIVKHNKKEDD